jgi:hypothetical protein
MENKIDFKNFTIAEFNSFVKSINNYGDISVSVSEGNNVNKEGTYTKKIDTKKLKDLSMSIGDSKEISVVTGSENIYADVLVYDNNYDKGYKEYTISLFSKDDKKGLKSVVNSIIEKFKDGGAMKSKKYDIGYGSMGNGTTVYNRAKEVNGDYQMVAHISDSGNVKFYDKKMPENIKKEIEDKAGTFGKMKKGGGVKKKSLMSMAHLVIADMRAEKIKDWYTKNHPTDDLGEELDEDVTFADLMNALNNKKEIYEVMGVGDSVIRERLFEHLTSMYDESYDTIYKKWLASNDYAQGGSTKGFEYSIGGL